jgi:hypothetical protein
MQTSPTSNRTSCTTRSSSSSYSRTSSTCRGTCLEPPARSRNSQFITSNSKVATRSRVPGPQSKHPLRSSLTPKISHQPTKPRPLLTKSGVCLNPCMARLSTSKLSLSSTSRWTPTPTIRLSLSCRSQTLQAPNSLEGSINPVRKNRFKIQM